MLKTYPSEFVEQAVRMAVQQGSGHQATRSSIKAVAAQVGCTEETLARWIHDTQVRSAPVMKGISRIDIALPDELLGSWISRVALENGLSGYRGILRLADATLVESRSRLSDVPPATKSVERMFDLLGVDIADVNRRLSTLPYWMSFMIDNRSGNAHGRDGMKRARAVQLQGPPTALGPFMKRRPMRTALQFCPECLASDEVEHGCAYFHRSHQLLASTACHLHDIELEERCPGCGLGYSIISDALLINQICRCGTNLSLKKFAKKAGASALSLAVFGHRALYADEGALAADHLVVGIRHLMSEFASSSGPKAVEATLEAAFGKRLASSWQIFGNMSAPTTNTRKGSYLLTIASPTMLSGLCVALGLDFERATELVVTVAEGRLNIAAAKKLVRGNDRARRTVGAVSVKEAKDKVLEYVRTRQPATWTTLRHSLRREFWCLAVQDRAWLEKRLGTPGRGSTIFPLPTKAEDRVIIAGQAHLALNYNTAGTALYEAAQRALYRDDVWLDAEANACRAGAIDKEREELLASIAAAKTIALASPSRPVRLCLEQIARQLGTTSRIMERRMARTGVSLEDVVESSRDWVIRTINWAAKAFDELAASPQSLLKMAGLSRSALYRTLVEEFFRSKNIN
jgi:hypothetical protein